MSLVAFAARVALVRILRSALPVGFIVVDSPSDMVATLESSAGQALAVVFAGKIENRLEGMGFFAGEPRLDLEIQLFLPPTIAFVFGAGQEQITLDGRNGADAAFDLLWRMIARALAQQSGSWGRVFGAMAQNISEMIMTPYLVETTKIRMPAREIRLVCEVLQEPEPGASATGVWADFIDAMKSDDAPDSVASLAPLIEAEILAPVGLAQGDVNRIFLGISEFASRVVKITATTVVAAGNPSLPQADQGDTMTASVADVQAGANGQSA